MATIERNPVLLCLGTGALAGMRSMVAPTWVACSKQAGFKRFLAAAATMEMVVDKLPSAPDRIAPSVLAGRALSGGLSAYFAARDIDRDGKREAALHIALGVAGAIAMSFGAFYLRRYLGRRFKVSDRLLGGAEDAIALGAGRALFRDAA